MRIDFLKLRHLRNRDQGVSSGTPHQSFNVPFLVPLAWIAEVPFEQIVRSKRNKIGMLFPQMPPKDFLDQSLGVIEGDSLRNPTHCTEGAGQPIEEGLLPLGPVGPDKPAARI